MTGDDAGDAPLSDDVADLARRIHFSRTPVVRLADVTFRLRQAGHDVTTEQVRDAILHPPRRTHRFTSWT